MKEYLVIHASEIRWIMEQMKIPFEKFVPCSWALLHDINCRTRTIEKGQIVPYHWEKIGAICLIEDEHVSLERAKEKPVHLIFQDFIENLEDVKKELVRKIEESAEAPAGTVFNIKLIGFFYKNFDVLFIFFVSANLRKIKEASEKKSNFSPINKMRFLGITENL